MLSAVRTNAAIETLVANGVVGGAFSDGLIAITARSHTATLVSLDERAMRAYERLGVDVLVPQRKEPYQRLAIVLRAQVSGRMDPCSNSVNATNRG